MDFLLASLLIVKGFENKKIISQAGPIAERSKSSDRGRGDPGSNPGGGRNFFYFLSRW